jgi:hypothetical protein
MWRLATDMRVKFIINIKINKWFNPNKFLSTKANAKTKICLAAAILQIISKNFR